MKPADMLIAVVFVGENYWFHFGPRRSQMSGYVKWPKYTDPLSDGFGDIAKLKAAYKRFEETQEGEWGWAESGVRPREYSAYACADS